MSVATISDFNVLGQKQVFARVPYVWAGISLAGTQFPGVDCSGLIFALCGAFGISIARTSESQFRTLPSVAFANLRGGDVVFYNVASDGSDQPAHVAIVWEPGISILQAPHTGEDVCFTPWSEMDYPIMGYGRLPFPNVAPSPGPSPVPVPIPTPTPVPIPPEVFPMLGSTIFKNNRLAFQIDSTGNLWRKQQEIPFNGQKYVNKLLAQSLSSNPGDLSICDKDPGQLDIYAVLAAGSPDPATVGHMLHLYSVDGVNFTSEILA